VAINIEHWEVDFELEKRSLPPSLNSRINVFFAELITRIDTPEWVVRPCFHDEFDYGLWRIWPQKKKGT
jgi:hypothetical protein